MLSFLRNQDDSTMDLTELAVAMGSLLFRINSHGPRGSHDGPEKILTWRSRDVIMTCHEPRTNQSRREQGKGLHENTPHNGLQEEQVKTGSAY